ncbi:MAG: hypothetical protein AAFZ65_06390 [Planctomycetota bacterium]
MQRFVIAAAVAAAGLLIYVLLGQTGDSDAGAAVPAQAAAAPVDSIPEPVSSPDLGARERSDVAPTEAVVDRVPEREALAAPEVEPKVEGGGMQRRSVQVVAFDGERSPSAALSGWLELDFVDEALEDRRVEVQRGSFQLELPDPLPSDRVWLEASGELDGQPVLTEGVARIRFAAGRERVLEVRILGLQRLFVRDAVTGAELSDVQVICEDLGSRNRRPHPGAIDSETVLFDGVAYPVELTLDRFRQYRNTLDIFVRAEGYTWQRLTLEAFVPATRVVELEPAGTVIVRPSWPRPLEDLSIRFRGPDEGDVLCDAELLGEDPLTFEGVPVGRWRVGVERGKDFGSFELVGSDVLVVAGGRAELPLTIPDSAAVDGPSFDVPVSVHVPIEWLESGVLPGALRIYAQTQATDDGRDWKVETSASLTSNQDGAHYEGLLEGLPPGVITLRCKEPSAWRIVQVSDASRIHFQIPPPRTVVLRFFDGPTGVPTDPEFLHLSDLSPGPGDWKPTIESVETGVRRFRTAATRLMVLFGDSSDFSQRNLELSRDHEEVELYLGNQSRLELRLMADGKSIELPTTARIEFEALDHEGQQTMRSTSGDHFTYWFSEPGSYRMTVDEIPGFEPVPARVIEVVPDEDAKLAIELVQKL